MVQVNNSFSQAAWQRLKKNKLAFTGLMIIIFSFIIAAFGYLIAPDNSPYADLQTVEIQAKKPGYEQLFLRLPVQDLTENNFVHTFLYGRRSTFNYIPITSWALKGDSIQV